MPPGRAHHSTCRIRQPRVVHSRRPRRAGCAQARRGAGGAWPARGSLGQQLGRQGAAFAAVPARTARCCRAAAAQLRRIVMMNDAQVSLAGYVATQPTWREGSAARPNLSMRVAWTPRRIDRATGEWVDGNTSFVTVTCWRKLADNVATCLRKGDPVLVQGRLSVRPYEDKQGVPRIAVDVDALSVGHDLSRGVAMFQRVRPPTGKAADEHAAER